MKVTIITNFFKKLNTRYSVYVHIKYRMKYNKKTVSPFNMKGYI